MTSILLIFLGESRAHQFHGQEQTSSKTSLRLYN